MKKTGSLLVVFLLAACIRTVFGQDVQYLNGRIEQYLADSCPDAAITYLEGYISDHDESVLANRLMARAYFEKNSIRGRTTAKKISFKGTEDR